MSVSNMASRPIVVVVVNTVLQSGPKWLSDLPTDRHIESLSKNK